MTYVDRHDKTIFSSARSPETEYVTMWTFAPPLGEPEASSGVAAMDKLHHDVFAGLDELSSRRDDEFCGAYGEFAAKVEQAFRQEEQWMEESEYAALKTHQEEHARVLGALHSIHPQVMAGELETARKIVDHLLPQWFSFHLSTMDATLAVAMQVAQAEAALLHENGEARCATSMPC